MVETIRLQNTFQVILIIYNMYKILDLNTSLNLELLDTQVKLYQSIIINGIRIRYGLSIKTMPIKN